MLAYIVTVALCYFSFNQPLKALRGRYNNETVPLLLAWIVTIFSFPIIFLAIGFGSVAIGMVSLELLQLEDFGGAVLWHVDTRAAMNFAFMAACFGLYGVFRSLRPKPEVKSD
jgi:hypothetical protein